MQTVSSNDPHTLQKANQHLTRFIDSHEQEVLPLPFFSHKVTADIFFAPIDRFFSEDKALFLQQNYLFLGEVLVSKFKPKLQREVKSIQQLYAITPQQVRSYTKMKNALDLLQIGDLIDLSMIRPLIGANGIAADTVVVEPALKKVLLNNPVFAKYWYIVCFEWAQRNYKTILN